MFNRQPFNRGRFNIGKKSGGMTGLPIVVSLTAENAEMYSAIHLIGDAEISLECLSAELKSNMLTAEPCNIRLTSEDGFLIKNVKLTAYSSSIYLSTEDGFLQAYNILNAGLCKVLLTTDDGFLHIGRQLAGNTSILLTTDDGVLRKKQRFIAEPCNIDLVNEALMNVRYNLAGKSKIIFTNESLMNVRYSLAGKSKIILTGLADLDFWLSEFINLTNVILAPGKTLVIDTEKMTINIDGTNIMSKLSNDSIFFDLRPGENLITYTGSKPAELRILWKDRYL
jgi:hypothetical protein